MALYSDKVMDHFKNPRNVGEIPDADGVGEVGNAKCGDIMKMYLKIKDNVIEDVKFETFGCGSAIASSSMATEMIKGKTIEEALAVSNKEVVEALDGLPAHKLHCSVLAEEAIKTAVKDYYDKNNIPYDHSQFPDCENCGSCKSMYQHEDITVAAQMALSCVRRVREHLGYYVGKTLIVQTLRGSRDRRVLQLGLDTLSTYGLMRQLSAEKVRGYLDFLEAEGYLQTNPDHFTLEPTAAASAVLFGGREVSMPVRLDQGPENEEKTVRRREPSLPAAQAEALFETLRAARARIAREESVPAYIVFSNAALADMAAKAPGTMAEFLQVSGVGAVKAARYGERFLRVIADHREKED